MPEPHLVSGDVEAESEFQNVAKRQTHGNHQNRGVHPENRHVRKAKKPGAEEGMIVAEDFLGVGVDAAAVPQAHEVV